jgi:hypothetical protein
MHGGISWILFIICVTLYPASFIASLDILLEVFFFAERSIRIWTTLDNIEHRNRIRRHVYSCLLYRNYIASRKSKKEYRYHRVEITNKSNTIGP